MGLCRPLFVLDELSEDTLWRGYVSRDMFNALRYLAYTGCPGDICRTTPTLGHSLPAVDALAGCARVRVYRARVE